MSRTGSFAVVPICVQVTLYSAASARNALSCPRGTATSARPADSLNRCTNAACPSVSGSVTRAPMLRRRQLSTSTWARPPSDRSCAALTCPARDAVASSAPSAFSCARSTLGGRPPRWPWVTHAHSLPDSSHSVSPSRNSRSPSAVGGGGKPIGTRRDTSSRMPSTPTTGVGWIAAAPVWL
jgi:hypothetical protein